MTDVSQSTDVNVPVAVAYEQWTRFETFPRFMSGVREIRRIDGGRTHWVTEIAGVQREFDAEITDLRPGERVAWRSIGGEVEHTGVVTFESLDASQTRVTVVLDWTPQGLAEKAGSALGLDDIQVRADLQRFKEFVEDTRVPAEAGEVPPAPEFDPQAVTLPLAGQV